MKNTPAVISMGGKSDSGKTTLILKLLPELKKRGYRVAVAKHCLHGFDLDVEGKDSWRFTQAGGEGTLLSSKDRVGLIRPRMSELSIKDTVRSYFADFDFVLVEGYNYDPSVKKMLLVRRGIGELDPPLKETEEIVAYVSDMPLDTDLPVYGPDDVSGIVSFLEKLRNRKDNR